MAGIKKDGVARYKKFRRVLVHNDPAFSLYLILTDHWEGMVVDGFYCRITITGVDQHELGQCPFRYYGEYSHLTDHTAGYRQMEIQIGR